MGRMRDEQYTLLLLGARCGEPDRTAKISIDRISDNSTGVLSSPGMGRIQKYTRTPILIVRLAEAPLAWAYDTSRVRCTSKSSTRGFCGARRELGTDDEEC